MVQVGPALQNQTIFEEGMARELGQESRKAESLLQRPNLEPHGRCDSPQLPWVWDIPRQAEPPALGYRAPSSSTP